MKKTKRFLEMFNVTVIFTRHDELGNCNSRELLKIIESKQPDVIFEEIGYVVYDQVYVQQNRMKLESEAVKAFFMTNNLEHIPVDTFDCPDDYYRGRNHLGDVLQKYFNKSERLKLAINQLIDYAHVGGFSFLNSDQNDILLDTIEREESHILAEIADDKLNHLAQLEKEFNSKRDEVMIDNIYKYGEEQAFQTAIFLIGAGHRRSIKRKLDKIEPRNGVEIKWHFLAE